ncbi:MAG: hypothetical protein MJK15_22965 [Colwellia sp.]|nr:hypothetical protein [Colwellia sp.]
MTKQAESPLSILLLIIYTSIKANKSFDLKQLALILARKIRSHIVQKIPLPNISDGQATIHSRTS